MEEPNSPPGPPSLREPPRVVGLLPDWQQLRLDLGGLVGAVVVVSGGLEEGREIGAAAGNEVLRLEGLHLPPTFLGLV